MVIVDSNIWISAFHSKDGTLADTLAYLLRSNEAAIVGIVISEVLQGSHSQREFIEVGDRLGAVPLIETSKQAWVKAAEQSFELRLKGNQVPLSDLVIAATALDGNHQVYTQDQHFRRIPGLQLHQAGTA